MSKSFTVVVVDDRRTERYDIVCSRIREAVPNRDEKLWWLSEFSLSSWDQNEIASGVAFDDVLDVRPDLLIFDLVLWEGDQALNKSHAWKRGLQLLETLYKYAKRLGRRNDLPTQAILMSATFGISGEDTPEFRQFKIACDGLAAEFGITITFFDWGTIASPSVVVGKEYQSFADTIKKIVGS